MLGCGARMRLQHLLPPLPGPNAGVRVQIQKDLLGLPRLLLDEPLLTAMPAGCHGWNDPGRPAT
jgi:hypothetical protein